jgi:hypothetical protein
MRVIGVKRGRGEGSADYEKMVGSIVEATNSQNTIKASDLRSNDRLQVRLQRDLRKLNYFYIRKAGRSHEWELAAQYQLRIRKEEAARAVMACQSAATLLNEGVQDSSSPPCTKSSSGLAPSRYWPVGGYSRRLTLTLAASASDRHPSSL